MFVAKVERNHVKVFDATTGALKRIYSCAGYKGAKSAEVNGDLVSVSSGDGKVRVYDIKTGALKRIF